MRIAVVDREKCNKKKCNGECASYCPRNRAGMECVKIAERSDIDEIICIGCGICVKKCPFEALSIVNLPEELKEQVVHQYGKNAFRIYRFPIPKFNQAIGLLGQNGIGKTTAVNILSAGIVPNLGNLKSADESAVIRFFRGTEAQRYFEMLYDKKLRVAVKPQHVETIPKLFDGIVLDMLKKLSDDKNIKRLSEELGISGILNRKLDELSGGELQRVAIAATMLKDADVYFFDEPSSFLDIKQRLNVARMIRSIVSERKIVFVVEHDLVMLDYLTDLVHLVYGKPGVYGICSGVLSSRNGINTFLSGYLTAENVRFRETGIRFDKKAHKSQENEVLFKFPAFSKSFDKFRLSVSAGEIFSGEICGVIGANATGKTTFAKLLAGELKPDKGKLDLKLSISYKPQYIKTDSKLSVYETLSRFKTFETQNYNIDINIPLQLKQLYDNRVCELSGGEMQRLAIAECLMQDAELYLLDEPSAHLDVEQRINAVKAINNVVKSRSASALVIDHDLMLLDHLAERMLLFIGEPGVSAKTVGPMDVPKAMNMLLKDLGITFRRDKDTNRPRANKPGSVKDREQRASGRYYA